MPDGRDVFRSDFDGRAVINLNGRDTLLKLVSSTTPKRESKKGDRSIARYRGEGVEVIVHYLITGLCAPDDEKCEVIDYEAVMEVSTPSGRRSVMAHGICGS
jgi:hypothetical protein